MIILFLNLISLIFKYNSNPNPNNTIFYILQKMDYYNLQSELSSHEDYSKECLQLVTYLNLNQYSLSNLEDS